MTKCQDCDLHFIDEGVRRERLYISDRECVECLKGKLEAEKDRRLFAEYQNTFFFCRLDDTLRMAEAERKHKKMKNGVLVTREIKDAG